MKSLCVVTIEALIDGRGEGEVGEGSVQDLMMEELLVLATKSSSLLFNRFCFIFANSLSDFTSTELFTTERRVSSCRKRFTVTDGERKKKSTGRELVGLHRSCWEFPWRWAEG